MRSSRPPARPRSSDVLTTRTRALARASQRQGGNSPRQVRTDLRQAMAGSPPEVQTRRRTGGSRVAGIFFGLNPYGMRWRPQGRQDVKKARAQGPGQSTGRMPPHDPGAARGGGRGSVLMPPACIPLIRSQEGGHLTDRVRFSGEADRYVFPAYGSSPRHCSPRPRAAALRAAPRFPRRGRGT